MSTLAQKVQEHHKLANSAIFRAIAAHKKYARGLGKVTPPCITVMTGGEQTYWVVNETQQKVYPVDAPSRTIGSLNLRVFDCIGEGTDQPLLEVGDHD